MEYSDWAPQYDRIRAEFRFDFAHEEAAARLLEELLPEGARADPLARLRTRVGGREAIVVGLAPRAGAPPLWRGSARPQSVLFAADGATAPCLAAGLVPDVVVTDLDGPVPSEILANQRGGLVVVHAHGDNRAALRQWVPQFPGELAGSWAGPPRPSLLDVGGFTDGDRAAYLAEHVGASRILLWGFDFEAVDEPDPSVRAHKRSKLAWARRNLDLLAAKGGVPLVWWRADGSEIPYPDGNAAESTR